MPYARLSWRPEMPAAEEQRLLENSLTELRFRYVQVSDEQSKSAGQKA